MNRLPIEKRAQILHLLGEGNSMRETSRIADVSINTVTKLLMGRRMRSSVYTLASQNPRRDSEMEAEKKILGSDEAWESGLLGNSEANTVSLSDAEQMEIDSAINESLGLCPISCA